MIAPLDLTVMMYHYIRDRGDEAEAGSGIAGMPVGDFERQLDELGRQHTFVSWREVRATIQDGALLPPSPCLLTFDDGIRDHYLHAFRILQPRGISGLFFILARAPEDGLALGHKLHVLLAKFGIAGLREAVWRNLDIRQRERFGKAERRYRLKYPPVSTEARINLLKLVLQRDLSADVEPLLGKLIEELVGPERDLAGEYYLKPVQIREMVEGGMHFGGHSSTHPWFDYISTDQRLAEIRSCADHLSEIEPGPWAFAYPYGGLSDDAADLLGDHGFSAAFTTRPQVLHHSRFHIGRLDGEELISRSEGHV